MKQRFFLLFILLFLPIMSIYSHPHTFMDVKICVVANEKGITGFEVYWVMDEMFTTQVFFECDKNKNLIFDKDEQMLVYDGFFANLQFYNFFTYINRNGKVILPSEVTNFSVKHETYESLLSKKVISSETFKFLSENSRDGKKIKESDYSNRLSYSFFIPFEHSFSKKGTITISCFDETFYCDIKFINENSFEKRGFTNLYDVSFVKNIGVKIEYDNTVVNSSRENATYTGVTTPDGLKIIIK
ncbi:MAG: DUF1007 family protein [Spirochaetales bacterium]|nr:DUF1007 family protein [Spirochaetales bacterium]